MLKKHQNAPILTFFYRKKSAENVSKSKHGHETHQFWSADNNFGVVRQLGVPAFQRRQARQNPPNRMSIRGNVLVFFTYRIYTRKIHLAITVPFDQDPHFNQTVNLLERMILV